MRACPISATSRLVTIPVAPRHQALPKYMYVINNRRAATLLCGNAMHAHCTLRFVYIQIRLSVHMQRPIKVSVQVSLQMSGVLCREGSCEISSDWRQPSSSQSSAAFIGSRNEAEERGEGDSGHQ